MKVIVLGSGVLGVTSAYYLAKQGHDVTVIDRQDSAAMETSFANAGEVSPGYATPWAAPGIPVKAIKWMFMKHAPLIINPSLDPALWRFMGAMLMNCNERSYGINKGRMVRLAEYSRDCLRDLRQAEGIAYDERSQGTLQLFRSQAQVDGVSKDIKVLKEYGVPFEVLDVDGCVGVEPGLRHVTDKIAGGLRLVGDETGDCFMFTQNLAKICEDMGVKFQYGITIKGLKTHQGKIEAVATNRGDMVADQYVMALGSYSTKVLKEIGVKIPVYPVKGYSITIPVTDGDSAPVSTIMDETHKVAMTRLGDRIRVAGMAELTGFNLDLTQKRRETVEFVINDLFPHGGDTSESEFWTGLRPMTPDSVPFVGPTKLSNLFLNTGHGTLGWTMACGSSKLLADWMTGNAPDIDTEGLTIDRYGRAA